MYRNVINELAVWYNEPRRKVLYIKGALGVGKTWIIKDFATAFFKEQFYVEVPKHPELIAILNNELGLTEEGQMLALDAYIEERMPGFDPENTLLIFDELQSLPEIAQFFYAYRKMHRNYNLCMIASSMQITEFEYHYVDVFRIIRMRPMSFEEYMIACKSNPLITAIENHKSTPLNDFEVHAILKLLSEYLQIGGMPEVVQTFIKTKDYDFARQKQEAILKDYDTLIKNSFPYAKAERLRRIIKSIPKQLANDNKKFMYRYVDSNARNREYGEAVQALCDLGLARKLPRLLQATVPMEDYVDYKSYELFMIDHGLLRAVFHAPMGKDLDLVEIFSEQNGAIVEQYIFEELSRKMGNLYYWVSGATARVPFVYESDNTAIPVAIQFVENKKAQNIRTFCAKNPNIDITLRISLEQVGINNNVLNIPAYGLWNM